MENQLNLNLIRVKNVLNEAEKEFRLFKMYYSKCKFACFDSGMFTYEIKRGDLLYELSFICDDTLLNKMTVKDLLELKRITYFRISKFSNSVKLTTKDSQPS